MSSQSRIAVGHESTPGTAVTPDRFLGITNSSVSLPDLEQNLSEHNSIGTGRRRFSITELEKSYGPATIDFLPTTGEFFWPAFGTETFEDSANLGISSNVHTLQVDDKGTTPTGNSPSTTANATELPTMTMGVLLEGGTNDFRRDFVGTTVDSVSVSLSESDELSVSMDFRAHDVEKEGQSSPSAFSQPTSDDSGNSPPIPYEYYDRSANVHLGGTFSYSSPDYTSSDLGYSGGRTWANVKSFDWSLDNNLSPLYFTRSTDGQKVAKFVTGNPNFSLNMELVPDSNLSGQDSDAVYDMLENGTTGDILIPFQRSDGDELHFVFEDAHIRSAPHELNEEGNEVSVSVEAAPEEIRVIAIDSIGQYSNL